MDHDLCKIKLSSVLTFLRAKNPDLLEVALCPDETATVPAFSAVRDGYITHIWPMIYKRKLLKAT